MQPDIPVWSLLPFLGVLLSIALFPVVKPHFWENNKNKLIISVIFSIPVIIFCLYNSMYDAVIHAVIWDYIPFIVLLGGLYAVTGGIALRGDIQANPAVNTLFLIAGTVLASIIGTTGASMLLIRSLIQTNYERRYKTHTILFFIALVANCGGLLTPLGDPPLFLLYLRGVEFTWFFNLFPEWLFVNIGIIVLYLMVESYYYQKESLASITKDLLERKPMRLAGGWNFIWILGIILSVAFVNSQTIPLLKEVPGLQFLRELAIISCAAGSYFSTKKEIRIANDFNWHPITEVACLFIGIFITMIPCLTYLSIHAEDIGLTSPTLFYYLTGGFSGILDNAPTALTFFTVAQNMASTEGSMIAGVPVKVLIAISTSSVFFGAMSYIGNGPNFMIKSIAEQRGIKMPGFFQYIVRFSLPYLLPLFIAVQLLLM